MTTIIGTQFRPTLETYEHTEKERGEKCNWQDCPNEATHWAFCHPDGGGCALQKPWCIDHVLTTVSKALSEPQYRVAHGQHDVLAAFITYTPKK